MTAPISIEEARRIVALADEAETWPKGSHVVGLYGGGISFNSGIRFTKNNFRLLTPAELELLKGIPELKTALEGK